MSLGENQVSDLSPAPSRSKGVKPTCFQELILTLQDYWAAQGCLILQPFDMEMGAGTFHTATTLHSWRCEVAAIGVPGSRSPSAH